MKSLLRHSLSLSSLLLAALIVTLAVLVSVARLLLPLAANYQGRIEADLTRELGQPVRFERLQAEWSGWGPALHLYGVRLLDATGQSQVLAIRELVIELDVVESLRRWTLVAPSHLAILGTQLQIQRRADGSLHVEGLSLPVPAAPAASGAAFGGLDNVTAVLASTRIRWRDEVTGLDYDFRDVDLRLVLNRPRIQVAGVLSLPQELGRRLRVSVDLRGDLGRADGWDANVYAKAEGVALAGFPESVRARALGLSTAVGDLESWIEWREGRLERLRARFGLSQLTWAGGGQDTLTQAQGDVLVRRLEDGWRLELHEFAAGPQDRGAAKGGLTLEYRHGEPARSVQAVVHSLRLQDLLPMLLRQSVLPEGLRDTLEQLHLRGSLVHARLAARLPTDGAPALVASGEFEDLGFSPYGRLPGLSGLEGEFSLDGQTGEVLLDSRGVEFDYPRLFARPLWMDELGGAFGWRREGGAYLVTGTALRARNQDLTASGRVSLSGGAGLPAHLDLQLDYGQANLARLPSYLPATLPKATHAWLDKAIVAGRVDSGRLLFFGRPADFPFANAEGVFEARFLLADGVLDYARQWPRLEGLAGEVIFRDQGMTARVEAGGALGARITSGNVRIEDLHRARLDVEAKAEGPLAELFRFLRRSPLAAGREALLDDVQASGRSGLDLSIRLPISQALDEAPSVRGRLSLGEVGLGLRSAGVDLSAVQGMFEFTEHGIAAEGITARFRKEPVTIDASTSPQGTMQVDATGLLSAATLLQGIPIPEPLVARLTGRSPWVARVTIPRGSPGQGPWLEMHSDLVGTQLDLPAPLGKPADQARSFDLRLPLEAAAAKPLELAYGDELRALLELARGHGVRRAELRFSDGPARLPESGVRIAGRLAQFSVSEWQRLAAEPPPPAAVGRPRESGAESLQQVDGLDVHVDDLELFRHRLRDVRLNARKDADGWRALVDSPMLAGTIRLPLDLGSGLPLSLDLEHLQLDDIGAQADEAERRTVDPRDLPALRVLSKRLVWKGDTFRDLRLEATRVRDGLQVHYLQLAARDLSMRGFGDWRVASPGQQQTSLRFTLESGDAGRALEELGFDLGLADGEGKFEGNLRWPGAPMDFGWQGLEGQAQLELRNGRLREIEPGVGRMLGFLNLGRLLSLSYFQQLRDRGFSFDKLDGNFSFRGPDVYTNDLKITGPVAIVELKGRTGIVARDYDHHVVVTPQVTSSLPVAGFFLGGPQVGIGLLALDRLLGGRLNPKIEYHVTGPWDDPDVEVLRQTTEEP